MCPQQRNARWWRGSTAADSIIEGGIGPTAKGTPYDIPREHTREQNASMHTSKNASGTLATCEPIDTAKTPFFPSLIDIVLDMLNFN